MRQPPTRNLLPWKCMSFPPGLSCKALENCHQFIMIPGSRLEQSLNVSVAGSIIMYD
jgi:SpoU rRNA Methylase family